MTATTDAAPAADGGDAPPEGDAGAGGLAGRVAALRPFVPGRREALFLLGGSLLGGGLATGVGALTGGHDETAAGTGAALGATRDDSDRLTPRQARKQLDEGNARFVAGEPIHPDQTTDRRSALRKSQRPFAAVLSCADSRVPPELLFDQGLGDLFVVRSAGEVLDDAVLGSLQYGIAELGIPLLVVLGHSSCGAVKATIEAMEKKSKPTGTSLDALVTAIRPAVEEATKIGATEKNLLSVAIDINVERIVEQLKGAPVLSVAAAKREVKIIGGTYMLSTGSVEWL